MSKSSINSLKRDMGQPIFIKIKIIPLALLEIAPSMHGPFCPIWQIFLPVYNRSSKRAGVEIFILTILHAQIAHLLKLAIEMSCSIILLRSSLQWGVCQRPPLYIWPLEEFCAYLLLVLDLKQISLSSSKLDVKHIQMSWPIILTDMTSKELLILDWQNGSNMYNYYLCKS